MHFEASLKPGQLHGVIRVQSQPNQGSTFSLYFPASEHLEIMTEEQLPLDSNELLSGGETILIVEDDPDIQVVMYDVLQELGYTVLLAADGEEGLAVFEANASAISLVIADIMMPKMKGRQFQEHVRKYCPDIKVLIVSGYQEIDLKRRDLLDTRSAFLQKPFDLDMLIAKVCELLNLKSALSLKCRQRNKRYLAQNRLCSYMFLFVIYYKHLYQQHSKN